MSHFPHRINALNAFTAAKREKKGKMQLQFAKCQDFVVVEVRTF